MMIHGSTPLQLLVVNCFFVKWHLSNCYEVPILPFFICFVKRVNPIFNSQMYFQYNQGMDSSFIIHNMHAYIRLCKH